MSNQINQSSQYSAGYIQYTFKLHVTHDRAISFKLAHSNTRELVLEKVNPADEFNPEWRMTVHFAPVHSIEEVDEMGNAIKDDIFDLLSFCIEQQNCRNKVGWSWAYTKAWRRRNRSSPAPPMGVQSNCQGWRLQVEQRQCPGSPGCSLKDPRFSAQSAH